MAIMSILMGAMGLGQALTDMADVEEGRRATNRVLDLVYGHKDLQIDSLSAGGERLKTVEGAIEFRSVCFRYPSRCVFVRGREKGCLLVADCCGRGLWLS